MQISTPMGNSGVSVKAIHYSTGEVVTIRTERGIITEVEPEQSADKEKREWPVVAPGLVDLQINGYCGCDCNQLPISESMVSNMIRKLWQEGVTSCYPTIITNSAEAIQEALETLARACELDPATARGIAGIHLEGPFISPQDGARGAHNREYIGPPDWEQFCRWQDASGGRIRIITLSPEWPESIRFIQCCAASGVTVSIGHTSATSEQVREAVEAGARMSTHLGNGTHLTLPRHPNYIWEQLAQDRLWTCVIADGFHLPDQVLKVVLKVKGQQAMLVSDAVSLSGLEAGTYTTHIGKRVVLTPQGRLHLADNEQLLAGSAQMLVRGIEHLANRGIAELAEAWDMSSIRPARFMGLSVGAGLVPGTPADFVLFHKEGCRIRVEQTYKAGKLVYKVK